MPNSKLPPEDRLWWLPLLVAALLGLAGFILDRMYFH